MNDPTIEKGFKYSDRWWTNTNLFEYDLTADSYFSSYAHFGIHEEMIKDTHRTTS